MGDLIWIGNTLLPRWFVFGAVELIVLGFIAGWVILTDRAGNA